MGHLRENTLVGSDKTKQSKTLSGPESPKAVEKYGGTLDATHKPRERVPTIAK